jgi:hypothetical protein
MGQAALFRPDEWYEVAEGNEVMEASGHLQKHERMNGKYLLSIARATTELDATNELH